MMAAMTMRSDDKSHKVTKTHCVRFVSVSGRLDAHEFVTIHVIQSMLALSAVSHHHHQTWMNRIMEEKKIQEIMKISTFITLSALRPNEAGPMMKRVQRREKSKPHASSNRIKWIEILEAYSLMLVAVRGVDDVACTSCMCSSAPAPHPFTELMHSDRSLWRLKILFSSEFMRHHPLEWNRFSK